jgi:cobalt-zinc-cadmium efflux system outer membrane protein
MDKLQEYAKKLVGISQYRWDAGSAPVSEVLQARMALSQLITQQNQALSQIKQARLALNMLMGTPLLDDRTTGYTINDHGVFQVSVQKTEILPMPDALLLDIDTLYDKAIKARPDLIAALEQVKANQRQIHLLQIQRIPDLNVGFGYPYLKINPRNAPATKTIPIEKTTKTYYDGLALQFSVEIPLFHNQGPELKQARATLEQSQLQVTATLLQLKNDVRTAFLAYELARENIRVYQKTLLPDAERNLNLAQTSYKFGKSPLANVILAQQTVQQSFQGYLQAVSDFQTAWTNLEQAVGEPLPL